MITKEEWEIQKTKEDMPLSLFWEVFENKKPGVCTLAEFERSFPLFLVTHTAIPVINTEGHPVTVDMDKAIKKVYDYFEKKFNSHEE